MPERPHVDPRVYYDELSKSYDRARGSHYHRMIDDLEIAIATPFASGARVLELGCGTGLLLSRLAEVAEQAIGVDVSERMAEEARRKGLEVRVADLSDLPFPDDWFDVTCSFKVLPHVPRVEAAIAEAARVTRPQGRLLLELYNPWSLRFLAKTLVGPRSVGGGRTEADVYTRWDSPRTIPRLLPTNVRLLGYRGVRVLTPFADLHRVPLVGHGLRRAEKRVSGSRLGFFGGFLVAVVEKL